VLYLDGVTVTFDGFKALNNLSTDTSSRARCAAIIGPNGAGKTTMMDIITGKTRPDRARLLRPGDDLTQHDEAEIAQAWHRPQVPEAHGVREPHACSRTSNWRWPGTSASRRLALLSPLTEQARIDELLEIIGSG
jgi:urea transport system ATP-binding protein